MRIFFTNHDHRQFRRYLLLGLALLCANSLTACRFSSSTAVAGTTNAQASTASSPTTATGSIPGDATPAATPDPLQHIGTITVTAGTETVSSDFSVAPPLPGTTGQPPADVLNTCGWTAPATTSLFIHGTVTVIYHAAIAEPIQIGGSTIPLITNQDPTGYTNTVAVQTPNHTGWACGNASNLWQYTYQPGTGSTLEWWATIPLISNSHPQLTDNDKTALVLNWHAQAIDQAFGNDVTTTYTGPNAATCNPDGDNSPQNQTSWLFLYNQPPYHYQATTNGGSPYSNTCVAPTS